MHDIAFAWPPGQLTADPRLAYNGISKTYARQVFESLVDIDPVTAQLRPWLASAWSRPDPLTVELTIAPCGRFSDGVRLTADLVRNSFCDIMTDLACSTPLPSAVAALTGLSAVESRGETVAFRFERHNAAFLHSLAGVNLAVSKPSAGDMRLGTGAWVPVDAGCLANGRDRLQFYAGYDGLADVRVGAADGFLTAEIHNPGISYGLCPNVSRGALADPRIRRALSLLIDRERLRPILQSCGYTGASSVLTPTALHHLDCSAQLRHDPATARWLLDAAGAEGLRFEVVFNSSFSPIDAELLAAVADQWGDHGIELAVCDVDFGELRSRQQTGAYDFRFFYYTAIDPDALRYQFAVDQRNAMCRTERDHLDDLLDAQLHCADPTERRKLVHDIQRRIIHDGLWLPIGNVRTVVSHRPDSVSRLALDAEGLARFTHL
ncbi:ABC transporter substrate-binding protein [Mycolicibacterium mucogenicum]|uniref:ABC transporter substrate-binding protein n=1 Tax=Mycolicibacterium mucogenicum TaxID=56689 RepID=UPI00226A5088|nr:ABC transporter substrate-binding protein [Mycolicibacterium mucogenicum]MCX8560567.1 ABC transporter substrate-binding protein [Mycolicibacterium mucogenicum]